MRDVLIIRADANGRIGTGHVMRCLALAQAWQDAGGRAVFLMADGADSLGERLRTEGMEVQRVSQKPGSREDAVETAASVKNLNASWIVVDGYHFDTDYQKVIKESGLRLLFVDDNGHCDHYYADIVLNQNIHANESFYSSREPYTRLLLGTEYVLLRREFLEYRNWKREIPDIARKVLVTMGGGDPDNVTLKVVKALRQVDVDGLDVVVVVGASNPHYEELKKVAEECRFKIELRRNVSNMPDLMAQVDIAISSAGTTSWELAFMGLPSILIVSAENQLEISEELARNGASVSAGWFNRILVDDLADILEDLIGSKESRITCSESGQRQVDGEGSRRVCEKISILRNWDANSLHGK